MTSRDEHLKILEEKSKRTREKFNSFFKSEDSMTIKSDTSSSQEAKNTPNTNTNQVKIKSSTTIKEENNK